MFFARGLDFTGRQRLSDDLSGRNDITPQVVSEIAVADVPPLVGMDGEIPIPIRERVVIDRLRLQAEQIGCLPLERTSTP